MLRGWLTDLQLKVRVMELTFGYNYEEWDNKLSSILWKPPWLDEAVLVELCLMLWKLSFLCL